jgi:hypothetical protein
MNDLVYKHASLKWDNSKLKECVTNLEKKVDRFQNMSFWQRLKFLIFGKKVFKNATQ